MGRPLANENRQRGTHHAPVAWVWDMLQDTCVAFMYHVRNVVDEVRVLEPIVSADAVRKTVMACDGLVMGPSCRPTPQGAKSPYPPPLQPGSVNCIGPHREPNTPGCRSTAPWAEAVAEGRRKER
jgi:hypothetical protein